MASQNTFNANVGVVAENATVGNIVVGNQTSVPMDPELLGQLMGRLDALEARVRSMPPEVVRREDARLIEDARGALSKGNPGGAWAALKKVSAWTLEVARDLGVDIGAAVIRQQAGLP